MSTRWNHQPYLLIRRLTLSRQLLEAQDPDSRNRQKFCRVVELSLPHELPLAFRSKVWQDKVCREKTSDKSLVIMALDKSLQEIEALAHRIEDTSLVGTFTLAIPHDKSPSKEYLISLQPLDLPILVKPEVTALTSCSWHPLYSDGRDKAIIAADLSLIKTEGRAYCAPIPELARNKKEADHYVRASIASEMEFPIANGQSKLLRLPTGDYKYSITQLNGPFSEEMFTTEEIIPISIGQVSWKNDRPRLVIKTW